MIEIEMQEFVDVVERYKEQDGSVHAAVALNQCVRFSPGGTVS